MHISTLACAGCGAIPAETEPYPFRCACAAARPDIDHIVRRTLDLARVQIVDSVNPFLRYRQFLHSYQFARTRGMTDAAFVDLVARLDDAVANVDGHGFRITPFGRHPDLERQLGLDAPGAVWIKDETENVSGSHKARHLMGVMVYLQVVDALGIADPRRRGLAIASCGNAALAAAIVARAAQYPLRVFVPPDADASVVDRIERLGADVERCMRQPGGRGDPCYFRFVQAVSDGALPFCCQGNENGLTIEGGATIGYELAEALASTPLECLVIQVGGGALASSIIQAFFEMRSTELPRFHAVQTQGAYPLKRAFDRVVDRHATMDEARTHRAAFMQPWDAEPRSIAHGILDDETYDWAAIVDGMLRTGGSPIVVSEEELEGANTLARTATGIDVDHTGSAGLAGLRQLFANDRSARRHRSAVVFTGVRRSQRDAR
jgi:threonine synthase